MNKILVATLVVTLSSADCFARWSKSAARASGTKTGNQMGAQLSSDSQKNQGVSTTDYDSLQKSSIDNLNNGQKGQATAMMMYGALAGAAAAKFGVCSGSGFSAYAACIAGGILLGMAMQSKKSADSFKTPNMDSYNNICEYSSTGCAGTNPPNPYEKVVTNQPNPHDISNMNKILEGKGFSVDPITGVVTTKDGKKINPSDRSSMEAALGPEGASALMSQVAEAEKTALAKMDQVKPLTLAALGFEGGGGGGGSVGTVAGYEDGAGGANGSGGPGFGSAAARVRKPAQVSGLSKNFNGDPIGVAADSIFMMMSRRYQLKSNQKTFLAPEFR